jgi:hypothetical protein
MWTPPEVTCVVIPMTMKMSLIDGKMTPIRAENNPDDTENMGRSVSRDTVRASSQGLAVAKTGWQPSEKPSNHAQNGNLDLPH